MPRLKQNVAPLVERAVDSLILAVELFNRPSNIARSNAVLILLTHSFEMLLKAVILQRKGIIHDTDAKYTYAFQRCLTICTEELKILSQDERATLAILDAQRDQAMHYYLEISEDLLYVHTQSSVTLFNRVGKAGFGFSLADKLPNRVLPVSAHPPTDLVLLLDSELSQVDALLEGGKRQGAKAMAKLRTVMSFVAGSRDGGERVSEKELSKVISGRRKGQNWDLILPEVAQLKLDTEGGGIPISRRIVKDAPIAVRIAQPGEEVVGTLLKQEINLWDTFNLSRDDLASKLNLTGPKTLALIYDLGIQNDPKCYREIKRKKTVFKGYSKAALDKLRESLQSINLNEVWERQKHKLGSTGKGKIQQEKIANASNV
jgi:hypothetical protein